MVSYKQSDRHRPTLVLTDGVLSELVALHRLILSLSDDCEVVATGEVEEVLAHVRLRFVPLVITEYVLTNRNRMDGLQLATEIKKISPHTLIMLHTMYGTSELEQSAREHGIDYYVLKPGRLSDYEFIVQDALKRSTMPPERINPVIVALTKAFREVVQWPHETADAAAQYFYIRVQQDYRAAYTPYGDTHDGLMHWIERQVVTGNPRWLEDPLVEALHAAHAANEAWRAWRAQPIEVSLADVDQRMRELHERLHAIRIDKK